MVTLPVVGYAGRDLQAYYFTRPLTNVLVVAKFDDYSYMLQTEFGQAFVAKFCQDSPSASTLQPGQKMKRLDYEQRIGCKSISSGWRNLGYTMYVNEDGSRRSFPITQEIANAE